MSWEGAKLFDEESDFLRLVNEGYRTWCLRCQKIQLLHAQLDKFNPRESSGAKLEMRVSQLKAMTLGQPPVEMEGVVRMFEECEAAMMDLHEFCPSSSSKKQLGSSEVDKLAPTITEEDSLKAYRDAMHKLDMKIEEIMEKRYDADMSLKEYEQGVLKQWTERKQASEVWTKRHCSLTGMRSAMRAFLHRHEVQKDEASQGICVVEETGDLDISRNVEDATTVERAESAEVEVERSAADLAMHSLSEVLGEGTTSAKEREEILKREHPGSADHPYGCRPCHFQGGLCWKGLSCSFCHICPKPKRKSKHQRDVDKRRQERYKQVKDDLGVTCLDELTKIDDARRMIMTSSKELKKRVKDAYASKHPPTIGEVNDMVKQMMTTVDTYHSKMPFLLCADNISELGGNDESGSDEEIVESTFDYAASGHGDFKDIQDFQYPAQDGDKNQKYPTHEKAKQKVIRRGNQRRTAQSEAESMGQGWSGKGKARGWEVSSKGFGASAHDAHAWGKKGFIPPMLPPMEWYGGKFGGPGPPLYTHQPMYDTFAGWYDPKYSQGGQYPPGLDDESWDPGADSAPATHGSETMQGEFIPVEQLQ